MNPPYNRQKGSGKGCRGRRPRRPAEGSPPPLQATLKGVRRAACPQAAAGVVGGCPLMGGHARPVGTLQASQTRPALRARTPLSLRDISPRSGESPLKGEPFARVKPAREASPSGEVAAEQAGRVQPVDGGHSKVAGRACPAPTDCRESSCTRGAREGGRPPLCSWRVVDRERAATQGSSESPSPLTRPAPFDKGASLAPCGGSGEHPNFKTEQRARALSANSNTAFA